MARRHASKGVHIKKENVGPVSHDYDRDTIILEIIAERFITDLQALLSSVEANKKCMSLSVEIYDQIKILMWNIVFWKNCNRSQELLNRVRIVRKA